MSKIRSLAKRWRLIAVLAAVVVVGALGVGGFSLLKQKQKKQAAKIEANKTKAIELYRKGKYAEAITNIDRYLKNKPDDYDARVVLLTVYIVQGKTADAYREAKRVYGVKKDPAVGYNLALLADKLGKDSEAVKLLKEVLKKQPDSLPYRTKLADLYMKYKKYDDAVKELTDILDSMPGDSPAKAEAYKKIADAYEATGDTDQAKAFRVKAEELAPAPEKQ